MGTKIIASGSLPDSRYEHDGLSQRLFLLVCFCFVFVCFFFHNLKSHSNGLNYKTRPFAGVHGSLMSRIEQNYKFYDFS